MLDFILCLLKINICIKPNNASIYCSLYLMSVSIKWTVSELISVFVFEMWVSPAKLDILVGPPIPNGCLKVKTWL